MVALIMPHDIQKFHSITLYESLQQKKRHQPHVDSIQALITTYQLRCSTIQQYKHCSSSVGI